VQQVDKNDDGAKKLRRRRRRKGANDIDDDEDNDDNNNNHKNPLQVPLGAFLAFAPRKLNDGTSTVVSELTF
jgi:hypothetical protein